MGSGVRCQGRRCGRPLSGATQECARHLCRVEDARFQHDEKPSIQALERAQGYLKLPNGRALSGHSHDYKRHGTSTLFAAFEVATGKGKAAHKKRQRRKEFLDFMDEVVAAYPRSRQSQSIDACT